MVQMGKKKLTLLVTGVLTVLAVMALAGTASAKETKLKCEGSGLCTFTATSGVTQFSIEGGDTVKCEASVGSGEVIGLNAERESTTSKAILLFRGCREQNTIFHFTCSNLAEQGSITTNEIIVHNIALPGTPTEAGALLTNAGVTFTCVAGHAPTQVTGSIIGEYENKCNTNTGTKQTINFLTNGDGLQKDTSYTGSTFRLEGKTNHTNPESKYVNSAQDGTGTLTFNQNVILTCS
jgi:hypothetical protein